MTIEQRNFGNTGLRVGVLGLGTAGIGFSGIDDSALDSILGAACEAGINVLDSAATYGDAEEKLGRALAGRRERFLLFTKCGGYLAKLTVLQRGVRKLRKSVGGMLGQLPPEWRPSVLQRNIEESLRRFRTDRIDLIQLHSCSEELLRRGEIIETLLRAKDAGKVRFIGYTGDGAAALWAARSGYFHSIQLSVNVADQQALDDVIPQARTAGLGIIAKRPIANAIWRSAERPHEQRLHAYWGRMRALGYEFIATPNAIAIALRFTLRTGVHTAIVGTTSQEHMQSNIEAIRDPDAIDLEYGVIRERWRQVAGPEWVGQR
jgi:hypothetical protein